MHPDDDKMDSYEPVQESNRTENRQRATVHCSEHSGNLEFFRSVKTRQNILIGGVGFVIAGMAWLYLTLYSMTSSMAVNTLKITILEQGYMTNRSDINTLKSQQTSNEEWHRMIEMREGIAHISGGSTENHHLEAMKPK
jgi:hypothetical protein